MEQQTDIIRKIEGLIAEPGKVSAQDLPMLNALAEQYPYFQPLHLLGAKAAIGRDDANTYFATAALYTDGQLLHNFIHDLDLLNAVEFNVHSEAAFGSDLSQPEAIDEIAIDEVPSEPIVIADDQEIYDEIAEVNIKDYQFEIKTEALSQESKEDAIESELVLENIVSTDFFAFQDNFKSEPAVEEHAEPIGVLEADETVISKYDDDKLPYTFLWWLAKTRKEHQQIFQPYASPKRQEISAGAQQPVKQSELQQQYVEHIFHMQSPFNEEENYVPSNFRRNNKEEEIIESFIKNEPQISPPKPEQINNENKARKSAEDHNDLVSETLAKIYIEQMLYDKAIETYEKLVLKFPEKSRYFADLIQSIEKKI